MRLKMWSASDQRVTRNPTSGRSTASAATLVKAGRLLDPRTGNILAPAAVLVEGDKIKEVGPPSKVEADAPAAG